MRAKFPKSGLLAISLLAVCLLAGAVPVAAAAAGGEGDRPVPPNPGYLFDKDAYAIPGSQVEAGGSQAFSKLSLRLYGGFSHVAAADVNEGSDGYFELLESYEAGGYGTTAGRYNPVHGGYDFGADIIYQLSPALGVGIGCRLHAERQGLAHDPDRGRRDHADGKADPLRHAHPPRPVPRRPRLRKDQPDSRRRRDLLRRAEVRRDTEDRYRRRGLDGDVRQRQPEQPLRTWLPGQLGPRVQVLPQDGLLRRGRGPLRQAQELRVCHGPQPEQRHRSGNDRRQALHRRIYLLQGDRTVSSRSKRRRPSTSRRTSLTGSPRSTSAASASRRGSASGSDRTVF